MGTKKSLRKTGFHILQSGYCEEVSGCWWEFSKFRSKYDNDGRDAIVIENNNNRCLSFGSVIGIK